MFPVGNTIYSAENLVPLSAGTNYVENPTVTYTTLTGEAFVRQMLTPHSYRDVELAVSGGLAHRHGIPTSGPGNQ